MTILKLVMTSDGLCGVRSLESHFLLDQMEERQRREKGSVFIVPPCPSADGGERVSIRKLPEEPGVSRAKAAWGHSGKLGQVRECPWRKARHGQFPSLSLGFLI